MKARLRVCGIAHETRRHDPRGLLKLITLEIVGDVSTHDDSCGRFTIGVKESEAEDIAEGDVFELIRRNE